MNKSFHILSIIIIILAVVASGLGLFYKTGGESYDFANQYGDTVRIYGDGIYKNDSFFMAPIFRGTDFTVLFFVIPLLIYAFVKDRKHNTLKIRLFLTSVISFVLYYATSIAFGVKYNVLHLVYSALFACCFFAFLLGFSLVKDFRLSTKGNINTKGMKVFLFLCGLSLFVAWLPDIIVSWVNQRPLELIEIYTTQITYVLDMAIISPVIFICLYKLNKKDKLGIILLSIILTNLVLIGITVIFQTIFHHIAGVELSLAEMITKIGIFVLLAMFGLFYNIKLYRNLN